MVLLCSGAAKKYIIHSRNPTKYIYLRPRPSVQGSKPPPLHAHQRLTSLQAPSRRKVQLQGGWNFRISSFISPSQTLPVLSESGGVFILVFCHGISAFCPTLLLLYLTTDSYHHYGLSWWILKLSLLQRLAFMPYEKQYFLNYSKFLSVWLSATSSGRASLFLYNSNIYNIRFTMTKAGRLFIGGSTIPKILEQSMQETIGWNSKL
ncbi:hypothetical protein F5Y19DRAFT_129830 [Xylariaceae sp. FL1651]|nr:hypothetical protein F5Y19DRAFT_129830 [Xylariaceae sp. FL1651]